MDHPVQSDTSGGEPGLGWLRFGEFSRLVGLYCSYLLPKQDGGTSQIKVNPTQVRHQISHPVLIVVAEWRRPAAEHQLRGVSDGLRGVGSDALPRHRHRRPAGARQVGRLGRKENYIMDSWSSARLGSGSRILTWLVVDRNSFKP